MDKSQPTPGEAMARIHHALAELLRCAPQSAAVVAQILELLGRMERDWQRVRLTRTPGGKRELHPRRGHAVQGYEIEETSRGQVLIEQRHPKDFRCPQEVYDTTVKVMEGQTESRGFDQILGATAEQLGYMPADYLCRLTLRFLMSQKPPLVVRSRAKYQPASPHRFVQQAQHAWKKLVQQSRK